MANKWIDITELIGRASSNLKLGELLHGSAFSMFDAMLAPEIGHPNMDAAVRKTKSLPGKKKCNSDTPSTANSYPKSATALIEACGDDIAPMNLSLRRQLSVLDALLSLEASWFSGQSPCLSIFSCLYILLPERCSKMPILLACVESIRASIALLRDVTIKACVCDEEDINVTVVGLPVYGRSSALTRSQSVLGLIETAIQMCEKDLPSLEDNSANAIDNPSTDVNSPEDDDGSIASLQSALMGHLTLHRGFLKGLLLLSGRSEENLLSTSENMANGYYKSDRFDPSDLTAAIGHFSSAADALGVIKKNGGSILGTQTAADAAVALDTAALPECKGKGKEGDDDDKDERKVLEVEVKPESKLPEGLFLGGEVNRHLMGPSPPRKLQLLNCSRAIDVWEASLRQLKVVSSIGQEVDNYFSLQLFIRNFSDSKPISITRSALHILLQPARWERPINSDYLEPELNNNSDTNIDERPTVLIKSEAMSSSAESKKKKKKKGKKNAAINIETPQQSESSDAVETKIDLIACSGSGVNDESDEGCLEGLSFGVGVYDGDANDLEKEDDNDDDLLDIPQHDLDALCLTGRSLPTSNPSIVDSSTGIDDISKQKKEEERQDKEEGEEEEEEMRDSAAALLTLAHKEKDPRNKKKKSKKKKKEKMEESGRVKCGGQDAFDEDDDKEMAASSSTVSPNTQASPSPSPSALPDWVPSRQMILIALGVAFPFPSPRNWVTSTPELETFLEQALITITNQMQALLLNRCRQRRRLRHTLSDWFNMFFHALNTDLMSEEQQKKLSRYAKLFPLEDPKMENMYGPLVLWVRSQLSYYALRYLLMGYELELYRDDELDAVYKYSQMFCDIAISSTQQLMNWKAAAEKREAAMASQTFVEGAEKRKDHERVKGLKSLGKGKHNKNSNNNIQPYNQTLVNPAVDEQMEKRREGMRRFQMLELSALSTLCGAMFHASTVLKALNIVKEPQYPYGDSALRYYQRFGFFKDFVPPMMMSFMENKTFLSGKWAYQKAFLEKTLLSFKEAIATVKQMIWFVSQENKPNEGSPFATFIESSSVTRFKTKVGRKWEHLIKQNFVVMNILVNDMIKAFGDGNGKEKGVVNVDYSGLTLPNISLHFDQDLSLYFPALKLNK